VKRRFGNDQMIGDAALFIAVTGKQMYNDCIEGRQLCGFPPVAHNNGSSFDIRVTNASLALIPNAPGMRALLFQVTELPNALAASTTAV
jgi:hypothetical protein